MTGDRFLVGMSLGVAAGMGLGMVMSGSKKREIRKAADKAIKAVGEVVDNLSDRL